MGVLEGKVAIVTGAGRGIGRGIAMLSALEGASVVVNDVGCEPDGSGNDVSVADGVVEEIRARGGTAIASDESVAAFASVKRMIERTLDAFGRIDIVVNNAGVLRDRMIFKMSEEEWDTVIGVHLKGTFNMIRHASPYMRENRWGRIVNFTSTSGLIGNFGQANYSAAKMGIVGLTKAAALDLRKYGVTANAIAPFAWTRLVATIPPGDEARSERLEQLARLAPDLIAPVAVYLSSPASDQVTGQVFGVRGKELILFSQHRPIRSIHAPSTWTPLGIASIVSGALGSSLVPLDTTADVFGYDPLP